MNNFIKSVSLLLILLNPFLLIIYLIDVVQKLKLRQFSLTLIRAAVIAGVVFCFFAILGDSFFSDIIQLDFASFQVFGGIVFLSIGLQFVFRGPGALEILRGESAHLSGAIAMPILIGPGSISASIVIGQRLPPLFACLAVIIAVLSSIFIMIILKKVHDYVRPRWESLIERYIEIAGRITSLFVGTVAVQMIMQGIRAWIKKF